MQGADQAVQGPAPPPDGSDAQGRAQDGAQGPEGRTDTQAGHPGRAVRAEHQRDDGLAGGELRPHENRYRTIQSIHESMKKFNYFHANNQNDLV